MTAAAIRKKLNPRNKSPNGVVPDEACNPSCRTGNNATPIADGSSAFCNCVETAAASAPGSRNKLIAPHRLLHNFFAVANETNAFGVVRYSSQYFSSAGRIFSTSSNGKSQSLIDF